MPDVNTLPSSPRRPTLPDALKIIAENLSTEREHRATVAATTSSEGDSDAFEGPVSAAVTADTGFTMRLDREQSSASKHVYVGSRTFNSRLPVHDLEAKVDMLFTTHIDGSADPETATPEIRIRPCEGTFWPDLLPGAGAGDPGDWKLGLFVRPGDIYGDLRCQWDPSKSEIQVGSGSEWVAAPDDTTIDVSVSFLSPPRISDTPAWHRELRELTRPIAWRG